MTRQKYSDKESLNRIQRLLVGKPVPQDDPGTIPDDLLSENEALSDITELLGDSLPNETLTLPAAVQRAIGNSGFVRGWGGGYNIFVAPNHAHASDTNTGFDANNPLQTITQAVSIARADRGDTIFVLQNDGWQYGSSLTATISENVTIPGTKPGITLVGVDPGSLGVNWQPANGTGTFALTVGAMDTTITGFNFWGDGNGVHLLWDGVDNYGENALLVDNTFTEDLDVGIKFTYSWYNKIHSNKFIEVADYAIYADAADSDPAYEEITNNRFVNCGTAIFLEESEYSIVSGNDIYKAEALVSGTATGQGIDFSSGAENTVRGNYFSCPLINWDNFCSASADDNWSENHLSDQVTYTNPS